MSASRIASIVAVVVAVVVLAVGAYVISRPAPPRKFSSVAVEMS